MLTVSDYLKIRLAKRDGLSIRAISRKFHHSHHTVRHALTVSEPTPYTLNAPKVSPKLDAFKPVIDQILREDEQAPVKQRHTAMQITRRLWHEHGFTGSYDIVRRYIKQRRRDHRETFIPLSHDPGQRLESDFGHIYVDFPEGRRQVPVLLCTWAYSNYPFAIALPTERIEAILFGMSAAFSFFGCVPREVWWDNPKTVVKELLRGHQRVINDDYAALASHYTFEPHFCMPSRGNEKPRVENRVYDLQRRWATPVPRAASLDELNEHLLRMCRAEHLRTIGGHCETVGVRFKADVQASHPLPPHAYDPAIRRFSKADKYQTVIFDHNRYSVPRRFAFQAVNIKAYIHKIVIVSDGLVAAEHPRSYERGEQVLDPLHYLVTLGRHPAALDHSAVYQGWKLPAVFLELRCLLEERHGSLSGARHYIRVLQLLADHSVQRVRESVDYYLSRGLVDADLIRQRVERCDRQRIQVSSTAFDVLPGPQLTVPRPDLNRFNLLLTRGETDYVREHGAVAEVQSEAVAFADHLG